jgi:AIR synthase-related protein
MSTPLSPPSLSLADLVATLKGSRGFAHKRDISDVVTALGQALPGGLADTTLAAQQGVLLGDDCAAIPDADGHLLLAIEGLVEDFVEHSPWFAGYSGVMVNLSDIAAMGGRPIAVVDALWSRGQAGADPVLQGMAAASAAYGVPIVGGHSNNRAARGQLAVAVLGRAQALLSSFAARPGQALVMAVDLRGQWEGDQPFWNASTLAPSARLRDDLALLPEIAEAGLSEAAKDISMAGVLGTALMLLECSQVGARIRLDAIPHPLGHGPQDRPNDWLRWLLAFPSFGFLLSVDAARVADLGARFVSRGIACAVIGEVDASREVWLDQPSSLGAAQGTAPGTESALLWDFKREPFIGPRPSLLEAAA